MKNLLKFGPLPMLMYPQGDEGGAGGGSGGAGDQGGGAGSGGAGAGDKAGGDGAGGQGANAGDQGGQGAGAGDKAGGDGAGDKKEGDKGGAGGDGKQGGDKKPEGIWGADWRESYAGDDAQTLAMLKRFTSPKDALDALVAAQKTIRSGAHKQGLAKDATPEQIAEYRKQNGIPEKAEEYLSKLPEGVVLGEEDKKGAEAFLKSAHDMNLSPDVVSMALKAYVDRQEAFTQAVQEQDVVKREECINALREEWGPEYASNVNAMHNFVKAQFPEDVQESLLNARLGDGTAMFNHPSVVKALAKIARDIDPTGTPTPGSGFDKIDTIEDKIKEYEGRMRNDRKNWFADEKAQAHYRQLLEARDRFKGRSGAR